MKIIKIFILLTVNYAICNKNDKNAVVESIPKEGNIQHENDTSFNKVDKAIIESFTSLNGEKDYGNIFRPSSLLDKLFIRTYYYLTESKIKKIEKNLELLEYYRSKFSDRIAQNNTLIQEYAYEISENKDKFYKNKPPMSEDKIDDLMSAIRVIKNENELLNIIMSEFNEIKADIEKELVIYKNYSKDIGSLLTIMYLSGISGFLCLLFAFIRIREEGNGRNDMKDLLDIFQFFENGLLVAMSLFLFMTIPL